MAKKSNINLSMMHDDIVQLYSFQDEQLMRQASSLHKNLLDHMVKNADNKQSVAIVALNIKLKKFIETFNWYYTTFTDERISRGLPAKDHENIKYPDIIHEIVKFNEALESCIGRHNNISITTSIVKLQTAIKTTLPLLSKTPITQKTEDEKSM